MEKAVAVSKCTEYDKEQLKKVIRSHFDSLQIPPSFFAEKRVTVKPNLLSRREPDKAVTTHPAVAMAVIELLISWGAEVTIAESPAGIYTEHALREAYKASGFMEEAEAAGARFNYDVSSQDVSAPDGVVCKGFHIITPICQGDIVVNLCKLKSHALTKMTNGVKNLFGVVPGGEKIEMHARFSNSTTFAQMLIDLCQAVCSQKPVITVCDAILAMEGEGPGTGTPRRMNALLTSKSPYALDLACCEMIGFGNTVEMIQLEKKRGLCPETAKDLDIIGTPIQELAVTDFAEPKSQKLPRLIKMIPPFLKPRPVIDQSVCVGCGQCARSCPAKTITLENKKAFIHKKNCIRCFCCQELCPYKAVDIKRSIIFEKIVR